MVAVVTGDAIVEKHAKIFEKKGVSAYKTSERTARVIAALAKYGVFLRNTAFSQR